MRLLHLVSLALGAVAVGGVSTAPPPEKLSDRLHDVAQDLGSSQPAADIDPLVEQVHANAETIDNDAASSSGGDAHRASVACRVFKLLFPSKYVGQGSSNYVAEVEAPV